MISATEAEVRERLHELLTGTDKEPIVILSGGAPSGVLIPVAPGEDPETLILGASPEFHRILEASHAQIDAGRHLSEDEFWAAVAKQPE